MTLKSPILLTLFGLAVLVTPTARADSFTFNIDYCTNSCISGTTGGTVLLTQAATNIVDVLVTLHSGLTFHDGGLNSFVFNILNNPTLAQIQTGTVANGELKVTNAGGGAWTLIQPSGNANGAANGAQGAFGYALNCTAGQGGNCNGAPSVLQFQINVTGLTVAMLETTQGTVKGINKKTGQPIYNVTNVDFAANVANGTCTGMIGAGNGTAASTPLTTGTGTPCSTPGGGTTGGNVPEPTTIALLGTVLAITVGGLKRRNRNKVAA